MFQKQNILEDILILAVDLTCIVISILISYALRYGSHVGLYLQSDAGWIIGGICFIYIVLNVFVDLNHHFFRRGYIDEFLNVIKAMSILLVIFIVVLYLMHVSTSFARLVFGYFAISGTLLMFLGRICLKRFMLTFYKKSKFSNRMILITTSDRAKDIIAHLYERNDWNRVLSGIILSDRDRTGDKIKGYEVVAAPDDIIEYVTKNDIDEAFFSVDDIKDNGYLRECIATLEKMGVLVYVNIETFNLLNTGNKNLDRVGKYAVVVFSRNEFSLRQRMLKRLLDIIGALVGMILLAIATIIFGPLIKLESPGPIFFGQTRIGKNGRRFTFYKFRSMYADAEDRKKELMEQNEMNGLMFKMQDDPRITKIGKFLRKTSIDELPQFWNVLRGDMSLVGTRPPTVDEYEKYSPEYKARLSMTPGITGLWQISGRSEIKDFDDVVRLDMEYIDDWNIMKDIKILIKTVVIVVKGRGAE